MLEKLTRKQEERLMELYARIEEEVEFVDIMGSSIIQATQLV